MRITYNKIGTAILRVDEDDEKGGVIVISEGVDMIVNSAFAYTDIDEVVLPKSLTKIGRNAFCHSKIKRVVIPGNVHTIEDMAFAGSELESVTFEQNPYICIGQSAFEGCEYLQEIDMSMINMQKVDWRMFFGCKNLRKVTFPSEMRMILANAFQNCDIREVNVTENIAAIGRDAFRGNVNLTKVEVDEMKTTVFAGAFKDCNLTHVRITHPSVSGMDNMLWGGMDFDKLRSLELEYERKYCSNVDRVSTILINKLNEMWLRINPDAAWEIIRNIDSPKVLGDFIEKMPAGMKNVMNREMEAMLKQRMRELGGN